MWTKSIAFPMNGSDKSQDNDGFTKTEHEYITGIPASFADVTREDILIASQSGYTANVNVDILACNYNGADYLVDEGTGERYDIKRSFKKNRSMIISLTCERRQRGKF